MDRTGENPGELPFGRTTVSTAELRALSEVKSAAELLSEKGVTNPHIRVERFFSALPGLLSWLQANGRIFPWRKTRDPWRVYITEILLQRTRASAVEEIYDSFFQRYPDPAAIRQTSEQELKELVKPLGFGNHRKRTLKDVAQILGEDHDDEVPENLEELKRPWRVGPYSARATMIFAFKHPMGLVDSNIARIIERVFGYEMPDQPHKSDSLYRFLDTLMPQEDPVCRAINLALLDLGDSICTPSSPACSTCPLASSCKYHLENSNYSPTDSVQ